RHLPKTTLFPYTTLFRSISHYDKPLFLYNFGRDDRKRKRTHGRAGVSKNWRKRVPDSRKRLAQMQFFGRRHAFAFLATGESPRVDRKSTRLNSSHVAISY